MVFWLFGFCWFCFFGNFGFVFLVFFFGIFGFSLLVVSGKGVCCVSRFFCHSSSPGSKS